MEIITWTGMLNSEMILFPPVAAAALPIAPPVGPHETSGGSLRVGDGPRKKSGKSQRFALRFSFLEAS
jgi:hypothetical protein